MHTKAFETLYVYHIRAFVTLFRVSEGVLRPPRRYECPALSFRVSNAEALDFGWRVREVMLFTESSCAAGTEVSPMPEAARAPLLQLTLLRCADSKHGQSGKSCVRRTEHDLYYV